MTDTLIAALHEHYRTVCDRLDPSASASREAMAEVEAEAEAEAEAIRLRIMLLPAASPGDLVHKLDILLGLADAGAINEDLEALSLIHI